MYSHSLHTPPPYRIHTPAPYHIHTPAPVVSRCGEGRVRQHRPGCEINRSAIGVYQRSWRDTGGGGGCGSCEEEGTGGGSTR